MHTLDEQSAKNVGYAFIKEYYGRFRSNPMELCDMYSKDSRFVRRSSDPRSQAITAYGVNDIKMHLAKLPRSKFQLSYVVCHPSVHGSILIRAEGTWLTEDGSKEFHQTFVLTPNANSQQCFYIYNDLTSIIEDGQPAAPPAPPSPPAEPVQTYVQPAAVVQPPAPVAVQPPAVEPVAPTPETATVVEQLESVISAGKITTVTAEQVETDLQNQVEEVIAEPEEDIPQPPEEAPEDDKVEEDEAPEHDVEEEPEEDTTGKTLSYADMVAKKNKEPVKRTQVVSGGKVPNAPEKKTVDTSGKRGVDRDLIGTLNLISSVKQSGGKKGGKGASGGKGAGNRGEKHSLYVKNIPKTFSETDAEKLFTTFGKISGKTIKAQDGYAFIDFDSREALDAALSKPSLPFKGSSLSLQERKGGNQRKETNDNRPRGGRKQ